VFLGVPLLAVAGLAGTLVYVYAHLELPAAPPPIQTTYLYDRDGNLVTTLHAEVNRTLIPLSDMPRSVRKAVVAVEDAQFYEHPGFDVVGIARAAWNDLIAGEAVQGGSTITQQLVKNVYAGEVVDGVYRPPDRTLTQKVREVLLAMKVESEFSKDEILANYLNTIYFGHGAYGVQAAAETYWGKGASDLTLLESATLAGLIAAPTRFDPLLYPADAQVRRDYVLDRMVEVGSLDRARAARMKEKPVRVVDPGSAVVDYDAPHFVDYAREYLADDDRLGETVYSGGYQITTTIDMDWQRAAERAVRTHLPDRDDPQASLVAIDPRTGAVRAMVGGRRTDILDPFNLATDSSRQAGSAFKLFTLAEAMEQRISLESSWYGPSSYVIRDERCEDGAGRPWTPSNAGDSSAGRMSLLRATASSVNTIFAQLVVEVGPEAVVDMAHRLGIRSELSPHCSITLGAVGVNPLEMTSAYATLAARGVYRPPTPVERVEGSGGDVLQGLEPDGERVLGANDADLVTYALRGVVEDGTGTSARLPDDRPVAGKTGTAQEYTDAWFCGYTPQLATCVWVGYKDEKEPMLNVEGFPTVYGGSIPALIWGDFMTVATAGMEAREFVEPSFEGYDEGPTPPPYVAPPSLGSPSPEPEPTESPNPEPTEEPSPEPTESPSPEPTPAAAPKRR